MTERYSFATDGGVIWSPAGLETSELGEGYVTAEEDNTQYLSVLGTPGEMSLENLNINLTNPKLEVEETLVESEVVEPELEEQVVVYSMEGSDELYGIQLAHDEDGNLKKYQFQFRRNDEGQLEAIPETIQVLPLDEDEGGLVAENEGEDIGEEFMGEGGMQIFMEEEGDEHILPDEEPLAEDEATILYEQEDDEVEQEDDEVDQEIEEEQLDVKPGVLALKQEIQDHQEVDYEPQPEHDLHETAFVEFPERNFKAPPEEDTQDLLQTNFEPLAEDSQDAHETHTIEYHTTMESDVERPNEDFEHVEVSPDVNIAEEEEEEEEASNEPPQPPNDSDNEEYQVVEGLHITGDVEESAPEKPPNTLSTTNILRHNFKEFPKKKDSNKLYLYVVQNPEKENLNINKVVKANPRSILKSSHALLSTQNEVETKNRRFYKSKEAMQARNFHNFINKTTIPQAPVRKDRLPRKQKIKPVERTDQEIVVQEVMVSSNGYMEAFDKENLQVTEYVDLTDSDEEYNPRKKNNKKKKYKRNEVTVIDSDSSDDSVIELTDDDDEPPKRRRGRPPKSRAESLQSPLKKLKIDEGFKTEIPCTKCDKTFPSQNSLKTHLQHHNLESTLRSAANPKYKCQNCGETFKNNALLTRHKCEKPLACMLCAKKFHDQIALSVHKRGHAKEQLVKTTTSITISPKKLKPKFKLPPRDNFKCKTCGRICSSLPNLTVHVKCHREETCVRCGAKFASRVLLDKHVRENCVKSPRLKSSSSEEAVSSRRSRLNLRVSCEECQKVFGSFRDMFCHKAQEHGMATPDKSALEPKKKMLHKPKPPHGGIPVSSSFAAAIAKAAKKRS